MTLLLASAARATVGGRSGQEDAFRLWPAEGVVPPKSESGGLLAVLADGMGGHTGGAIAGQTACKTFAEVFSAATTPVDARLKTALQASNEALAKGVEQNAALRGMGCTLVAAWIDDLGIRWTSVGDSLLLLYRVPDVIRLNADHSLGSFLDEQARQNRISRSEARRNRNRNALRSALTGSKIDLIDLRAEPLELRPGDWVLLASDGICSLEGDEIADVVYRYRQSTPEEMAEGLIAAVTEKGVVDQDNATVVAVRVEEAKSADDVTTRVMMRPATSKKEDVDLRTRRIGVSRPVRASGRSRKAAVWLATAAVVLISAAAVLVALPSLRTAVTTAPTATTGPDALQTPTPAKAAVEPGASTPPRPAAPDKAPGDAGAQPTAPSAPPGKPAGENEEGSAPRQSPSRSSALPPPAPPAKAGRSGDEPEEGSAVRSGVSKAPPAAGAAPARLPGESEEGGARSSPSKSSAAPGTPPGDPGRKGEESPAARTSAATPPSSAPSGTDPAAEGEEATPGRVRSGQPKSPAAHAVPKVRPGGDRAASAPPPAKSAAASEQDRKRAKPAVPTPAPTAPTPEGAKRDFRNLDPLATQSR